MLGRFLRLQCPLDCLLGTAPHCERAVRAVGSGLSALSVPALIALACAVCVLPVDALKG
jgi:hypothetical protein